MNDKPKNKEEVIAAIMTNRQEGSDFPFSSFCDDMPCSACPLQHEQNCEDYVIRKITDRFIDIVKDMGKDERVTNLEYYIIRDESEAHLYTVDGDEHETYSFVFKPGTSYSFFGSEQSSLIQWLLSPYKPPKPKYRLTKLESDLLKLQEDMIEWNDSISQNEVLLKLKDMGHFKGISAAVPIRYILANCEVVDDD